MGATYSFIETEQKRWTEHDIKFDEKVRASNFPILDAWMANPVNIYLGYQERDFLGLKFQHWFVTNGCYFLEFGASDFDIYSARVQINTLPRSNYTLVNETGKPMDNEVFQRIHHVLGMYNYSLCLRNCEHVANYVFRGLWISNQMNRESGVIYSALRNHFLDNVERQINSFPSTIRLEVLDPKQPKIYSTDIMEHHYTARQLEYYLDYNEDTYNILVLRPTGAGKSRLINVFFNHFVCREETSHRSVTKEIYFVRGRGQIWDFDKKTHVDREIVVADTVGICDTEWDDKTIINMIRQRIDSNFKYIDAVFVVFQATRLIKEYVSSIKEFMKWLGYDEGNHHKFLFVGTFAENLTAEKEIQMKSEAVDIFGLKKTLRDDGIDSLVYIGFPPEDMLNDVGKFRVHQSWMKLQPLLLNPESDSKGISPELRELYSAESESNYYWKKAVALKNRIQLSKSKCTIL